MGPTLQALTNDDTGAWHISCVLEINTNAQRCSNILVLLGEQTLGGRA